ncbi:MAG: hypothetical protein J6T10_00365 [Methanobrevibacter sp.]|nr:hypothetical protein [Methanobrevibacter sp.]
MARKTPTKKQRLNRQYREQIRRIKKNYSDIERMGGIFSQSLNDIIKPVKKPTEATIRRLKAISKNDLYRMAKTETGQPGWKLRLEREERARSKRYLNKIGKEYAFEYNPNLERYWKDYTRKQKQYEIDKAWDRRLGEAEAWKQQVEREAEKYQEPEEPYQWVREPEPEPEPDPEPELQYEEPESYEEPEPPYDFGWTEDIAEPYNYRDTMLDTIQDIFNRNQNYDMMNTIRQEFEDMIRDMDDEELKNWLDENQQDFIDAITEVEKYLPSNIYAGTKGYSKATELINNGVTPLENFYNTSTNHVQARSTIGRKYFEEKRKLSEDDEEDKTVRETFIDRLTGEMISAHLEQTYDGWSWFDDEYNLPLSVNIAKGLRYLAVSEIKENEDYF